MTTHTANQTDQSDQLQTDEELEQSTLARVREILGLAGSQLSRVMVFVPIFGIGFLLLGFLWVQGAQKANELDLETQSLRTRLSQPAPQPELLLRQADGWDTAYEAVLNSRTSRLADSDLVGKVIDAAWGSGLVVEETGTTDDGIATVGVEKYVSTPVLLKAVGTFEGIADFLELLETDEFSAFEIQSSLVESQTVGYQLTLKGLFYSLPENFAELSDEEDDDSPILIPIQAVEPGEGEVAK
jgi:Tfp pilus assembly protein PilO